MSGIDPIPRELAYEGVKARNPPDIISSPVNPTVADFKYPLGTMWMNTVTQVSFQLVSNPGVWAILGGAVGGDVQTLTGTDAVAVLPALGNINVTGVAAQGITSSGAGSTITFTNADAAAGQKGVAELATQAEVLAGLEATKIVTPATLQDKFDDPGVIGNSVAAEGLYVDATGTGFDAVTITADPTFLGMKMLGTVGEVVLRIDSGDLAVLNGNIALLDSSDLGKKMVFATGNVSNCTGTATLAAGTATVLNTTIEATDLVFLSRSAVNASTALGNLSYTINAGVSLVIDALDNSTPGSVIAGDLSDVSYLIVGTQV